VHVGGCELHGQWQTVSIDQEVVLAACFATIGRVRASVFTAALGADADAVHAGTTPVDGVQIAQPVQDHLVHCCPDAQVLPLAQTTPAGHAAAIPQLQWQITPTQALTQDEQDATECGAVSNTRWPAVLAGRFGGEQRLDCLPQIVTDRVLVGHLRAYIIEPADRKTSLELPAHLTEMSSNSCSTKSVRSVYKREDSTCIHVRFAKTWAIATLDLPNSRRCCWFLRPIQGRERRKVARCQVGRLAGVRRDRRLAARTPDRGDTVRRDAAFVPDLSVWQARWPT
jgi:hypothetical protein